jgi:hypothetical protein
MRHNGPHRMPIPENTVQVAPSGPAKVIWIPTELDPNEIALALRQLIWEQEVAGSNSFAPTKTLCFLDRLREAHYKQ